MKTAVFLQTLKETASRTGELQKLKWIDVDLERKTMKITPEKGSNARILPISEKLIAMLKNIPNKTEYVFPCKKPRKTYESVRKRTALKLNNPRLLQINLHTFRHWKATTEYHNTKDIIHVAKLLGHKNIKNTMIYINLDSALWLQSSDQWTSLVTHSIEEETKAVDAGFELVRSINETTALYKKRK
jgi:integrase